MRRNKKDQDFFYTAMRIKNKSRSTKKVKILHSNEKEIQKVKARPTSRVQWQKSFASQLIVGWSASLAVFPAAFDALLTIDEN
jgi:hypothetical protein